MKTEFHWSTIAAIVFALVFPTIVTWGYFVALASTSYQQSSFAIGKAIQFSFPLLWIYVYQRRRFDWTRPNTKGVGTGMVFGLVVLSAMLLVYHFALKPAGAFDVANSAIQTKVLELGADSLWKYGLLTVFYVLGHSLLEEYYWRWFVFGQLREVTSPSRAIVISSIGFMAHHVLVLSIYFGWTSPLTLLFSVSVAVGGAFWSWLYDTAKSLYAPWVSHMLVDLGIFVVGYDIVKHMFQ